MSRHQQPQGYSRTDRLADQIHRSLSELIQREVRDPRLGMVTVQHVRVSADLGYADVYFTVLDQDVDEARASQRILARAAGFLRSRLAAGLNTRVTPQLRFHFDEHSEQAHRLDDLIAEARRKDDEHGDASADPDEHGQED
jgi:ribosome-binding factor A